jgi:3-methyl-2-oxobutanoate hydroxymethyltransferase
MSLSTPSLSKGPPVERPVAPTRPVTVPDFLSARSRGAKLAVLTAYDYTTAKLLDEAGVDAILVGDSLGMVVQGNANSLSVTVDEIIYHTRCVARGVKRALLIGDMPFLSYQVSPEQAVLNAGRIVKEGGAQAVKLEGGERSAAAVAAVTRADIPVVGHIGLTPQSVHRFGGFRVQRDEEQLLSDARAIAAAGAFAIVLECVPMEVATRITAQLSIPTIGIGAGNGCDGQVLVVQDMLGMFDQLQPRFVKRFAELGQEIRSAVADYCREVRQGSFPGTEHSFR